MDSESTTEPLLFDDTLDDDEELLVSVEDPLPDPLPDPKADVPGSPPPPPHADNMPATANAATKLFTFIMISPLTGAFFQKNKTAGPLI